MRRATLRAFLVSIAILLAGSASGASAAALRAHAGDVSTKLTWTGTQYQPRNVRLSITKAGQVRYDRPVAPKSCQYICMPGDLRVVDLDGDGEPEVFASFFSGGAHCCEFVQIFRYHPATRTYSRLIHDFGDYGANLQRAHRGFLFITADEAFVEQYTSFAASGAPIRILRLRGTGFVNVTRGYPKKIAADAARWWRFFKLVIQNGGDTEGALADWAADEYLLGHRAQVTRTLKHQAGQGHVHGAVSGRRFLTDLPRFLKRHGYG